MSFSLATSLTVASLGVAAPAEETSSKKLAPHSSKALSDESSLPISSFGSCTHFLGKAWDADVLIPQMKSLGMTVVRNDFYWRNFEKEKGKLVFPEDHTAWINKVESAGLKIIPILCYGNKIYATAEDKNGLNIDAYLRYVRFVVTNMKGRPVAAWQIWNEPNNFEYRGQYGGHENGKDRSLYIAKFAEMVERTAALIRELDPKTPIITGVSKPAGSVYMMQDYPKAWKNIDAVTDHPYPHRLPPETCNWGGPQILARDGISVADDDHSMASMFRHLREASTKNLGRELPIWITEMGYPTFVNRGSHDVFAGFTEEAQAAYLARFLVLARWENIKMWCLYTLVDEGSDPTDYPKQQYSFFGVLKNKQQGFTPKKAFQTLRWANVLLGPDATPIAAADAPGKLEAKPRTVPFQDIWSAPMKEGFGVFTGPLCYWFKRADAQLAFVWEAGRYDTETTSVLGTITFQGNPGIQNIEAWSLQHGQPIELSSELKDGNLVLTNVPVGNYPVAIRIRK